MCIICLLDVLFCINFSPHMVPVNLTVLVAVQGGLAGLLLRLRQDGHGQLVALGPQGLAAHALALRHFMRWRHPVLRVSECDPLNAPVVFQACPTPLSLQLPAFRYFRAFQERNYTESRTALNDAHHKR